MKIKYVYIKNGDGFGNKIFDLIFAVYLFNLYNKNGNICKIYYILVNSKHEKPNDPKLYDIFKEAKNKIIFMTQEQYQKINKNPTIKIKKLYDYIEKLDDIPKYEDLDEYTKFNDCFQLVYKMYSTFNEEDKNIFKHFNENIITDKRVFDYKKIDYIILHIRYGDKLNFTVNNIKSKKNINEFLLYTPEYYVHCIFEKYVYLFNKCILIIITDSPEIINYYITSKYYNKNNFIIFNSEWFNEFYLLYFAKGIILSISTFCFAGAYFNEKATSVLLMDKEFLNNENLSPEFKSLSDKWIINYDNKYILNYDIKLLLAMSQFNIYLKKHIKYIENKVKINIFKNNIVLPYNYNNTNSINSDHYLFILKIKFFLKFPKDSIKQKTNKFRIELFFNKILLENNIKECVFITRDIFLPIELYQRLQIYSSVKINIVYTNETFYGNDYKVDFVNNKFVFDDIYKYINNDSLLFFTIKEDYGVEFDLYYDYYMFKINEYLNNIKDLKLCIIHYMPNMILPFTLNTLKNIANYAEKYEILYVYNGITIIYHNIKNYNIDILNLKHKFNNLYNNIVYFSNEDIMTEIFYAQSNPNSIASTYFIKFNNNIKIRDAHNYKYKIEIIDLEYKIKNDQFVKKLLPYIHIEFDRLNHMLFLYNIENVNNELLFIDYYITMNKMWIKLLDENTKYDDIKQNLNEMKKQFQFKNNTIKFSKTIKTKKYKSSFKSKRKISRKITNKLSLIMNTLYKK